MKVLRIVGNIQVFLGLLTGILSLIALVLVEKIVADYSHIFSDAQAKIDSCTEVLSEAKHYAGEAHNHAGDVANASSKVQVAMAAGEGCTKKLGNILISTGVPNGIADWGVSPPRLTLSWYHPWEESGKGCLATASDLADARQTVQSATDVIVKTMRDESGKFPSTCDATMRDLQDLKATIQVSQDPQRPLDCDRIPSGVASHGLAADGP